MSDRAFEHSTISDSQSPLFKRNPRYKPFNYPWAFTAWLTQQRLHWLHDEINMAPDIKDWANLNPSERNLLTQIFRFFTQADIEVGNCYLNYYCPLFQPTEVKMMLASFANMETVHIAAYSHLLDSVGMPEVEYQAFLEYQQMKDKWTYMQQFQDKEHNLRNLTITLAAYGAFTEGLQLFASFAMLLNFPRFGKMRGMGQIVAWSVRDETLHIHSMIKLFHTIVAEHPGLWTPALQSQVVMIAQTMVQHEDAFIDLAFELGGIEGMTPDDIKRYIRYIADRRLVQLGLEPVYHVEQDPLPWMAQMLGGIEHANFFEARSTEYSKSATQGSWEEVFPILLAQEEKQDSGLIRSPQAVLTKSLEGIQAAPAA
jgi:ribonucleoside-diphosphate reductase beta chain